MGYKEKIDKIFVKEKSFSKEEINIIIDRLESRAGNPPDRKLNRMRVALNILDLQPIKVVNIVGTNGKGTVSKAIFDSLNDFDMRVGLYTSPHLVSYNERIITSDGKIPDNIFYALIDLVSDLEAEIKDEYGNFTYFEVLTLVANIYFANKNLDLVILEAGVGGRCDATKALGQSILSVITSLSIDHISALGSSIESIAWHKAGIMKDNTSSITLNKGLAHDVINEEASKLNNFKLYDYKDFILPDIIPVKGEFEVTFENKNVKINPKQFGLIRGENFPLAYAAIIKILEYFNIDVDKNLEKIANSLSNSQWKGRMQVIGTDPLIILDGAHNVDAIEKLFKSIEGIDHKRLITIIAIMDRKNHEDMTKFMRSKSDLLIVTSNGDSNSTSIDILSKEANADQAFEDIDHALAYAKKIANPDDLILIAGSLYLVGEVLKLI